MGKSGGSGPEPSERCKLTSSMVFDANDPLKDLQHLDDEAGSDIRRVQELRVYWRILGRRQYYILRVFRLLCLILSLVHFLSLCFYIGCFQIMWVIDIVY